MFINIYFRRIQGACTIITANTALSCLPEKCGARWFPLFSNTMKVFLYKKSPVTGVHGRSVGLATQSLK